jgi:ergothioneine biosynthesis protein EgtB
MTSTVLPPTKTDRSALVSHYQRIRERSHALFDLLADEDAYYSQPIPLRHPIVFYEGHLPAFGFNTLVKTALQRPQIDARLETLFARGIDPDPSAENGRPASHHRTVWPSRAEVRAFAAEADAQVLEVLAHAELEVPGHPLLDRAEAVFTILEHEVMHQETLLYIWHRLPLSHKRRPGGYQPRTDGVVPANEWIEIPAGTATLGVDRGTIPFGWDNEFGGSSEEVPGFTISRHNVTNAQFLEFVDAGGYRDPRWWRPEDWTWVQDTHVQHPLFWERDSNGWFWRGMFDRLPLPPAWPVYVSQAEAVAYTRWRGTRLPSEAEFQRAAYGDVDGTERPFPWGVEPPTRSRGVFDFTSWDPEPVGSHPAGRSAWGVDDLVGNGWEWTHTVFAPFPGFRAMPSYPQYSADFFDGAHFVLKGASPGTGRELLRPTFRNWFRSQYPYVYASFRCVQGGRDR